MLWLSQCRTADSRGREVTPRVAGPPLGLNGHEGDFRVTEYFVHTTGTQKSSLGWILSAEVLETYE